MLKIAICDDEEKYVEDTASLLKKYSGKTSMNIDIEKYIDGNKILDKVKASTKFDIIFLDIEMDNINGIELAERIREIDTQVPIVYITSYEDYWKQAYRVHAFQFVVKPIEETEIFAVMDDYIEIYKRHQESKVLLNCEGGTVLAMENEILYFYIERKKKVHAKIGNKEYIVKENLKDIYIKLNKQDFYVSHKSCIINLNYVRSLENGYDIIMEDGEFVPLAQNRRTEFLEKLTDRYLNTVSGGRVI